MSEHINHQENSEHKIIAITDHYNNSIAIHKDTIKKREVYFYINLIFILLLFYHSSQQSNYVVEALNAYTEKNLGKGLVTTPDIAQFFLWLLTFVVSTKYYQVNIEIEKQYLYIFELEAHINSCFFNSTRLFTRESTSYRSIYRKFSKLTWFIYTVVIPFTFLFLSLMAITNQCAKSDNHNYILWLSFLMFICFSATTIVYLYSYHFERKGTQ